MTESELKHCPFDGGKAEYRTEKTTYSDHVSTWHDIFCATCSARMTKYNYHRGEVDPKQEAATRSTLVKEWNTRK